MPEIYSIFWYLLKSQNKPNTFIFQKAENEMCLNYKQDIISENKNQLALIL